MQQAGVSKGKAVKVKKYFESQNFVMISIFAVFIYNFFQALKNNNNDIVNAIMELTM